MPYRFRGLGAQVADTRFGPVASSLAIAPSGSAAFRNPANAAGANSGQGVMVAIDPLPPITGPATLVTTNITQPAAVQPVSAPVNNAPNCSFGQVLTADSTGALTCQFDPLTFLSDILVLPCTAIAQVTGNTTLCSGTFGIAGGVIGGAVWLGLGLLLFHGGKGRR